MPLISRAQQRYFGAHRKELEKQGVDVGEWFRATDFSHLPERKKQAKQRIGKMMKGK
jgi:peptide methionine sulfoxide reductase MsrA